jgi:Reverse transcriptase (RNA-dependent DNA polymerase)
LNLDVSNQQGLPLHHIFLDISKAYDTVDRSRLLSILQAYGMGPNLLRILKKFWDNLQVVPRQSGYYGSPIPVRHGVTQGDPLSPTIFNIVIDAAVRELYSYPYFDSLKVFFYADDGLLTSTDPYMLQAAITILKDLLE